MKPLHFVPPVIALAIAGGLVGAQRQKISRLENETIVLRKHIADQKNAADRPGAPSDPSRPMKPESSGDGIDWAELAESMDGMRNGGASQDMRKMMSLHTKLQKMDKEQIIAALEEIKALDLDDEQRAMLESMLVGPLVSKDPELALTYFKDRIGDEGNGMSWQLSNALGEWAKKDLAAATAWFDKEIAAGTFDSKSLDGKSSVRMTFEAGLVFQLISTNPAAAEARISALPADQRKDALSRFSFRELKDQDQEAYANLVRSQLTEEESHEVLGQRASMIAMKGELEDVSGYLDRIGSKGEERLKATEEAAKSSVSGHFGQSKVTVEKVDSMREWLGTQAPGSVDKVTGEALGTAAVQGDDSDFPEVLQMALKYHDQGGGDDILTGFLKSAQHYGREEELRSIAEKISDPKKRVKALKDLD